MESTIMTEASDIVVDGLAEQIAKMEAEKAQTGEKAEKAAEKVIKKLAEKQAWATKLAEGTLETASGKIRHNPHVDPDTVRPTAEGELINGKAAKGWAVEIICESCGDRRTINLQDAFQVTRCTKAKCRKKNSAKGKLAERTAEVSQLPIEEQQALLEKLQAEATARLAA